LISIKEEKNKTISNFSKNIFESRVNNNE